VLVRALRLKNKTLFIDVDQAENDFFFFEKSIFNVKIFWLTDQMFWGTDQK